MAHRTAEEVKQDLKEGKALLKDDLRERLNALLDKGEVQSVMFTEFVVQ